MVEHCLEKLLPHRPPMVFISDIKECDLKGNTLIAEVDIKKTDLLYQESIDGVSGYAALEYMAQAVGCFVGHYDLQKNPNAIPGVGFVLGTRKLSVRSPVLKVNHKYFVSVKSIFFDETIASFECLMCDDGERVVSEAIINVYRPTDIEAFKRENL